MSPSAAIGRSLRAVALVALTLSYPLGIYLGLTTLGLRWTSVGLAAVATFVLLRRLRARGVRRTPSGAPDEGWAGRIALLAPPVAVVLLVTAANAIGNDRLVLLIPALVNLVLLLSFGGSLVRGVPIVERFARLIEGSLSEAKRRYCRAVTGVWTVFFLVNGSIAAALAFAAPLTWWTLYNGLLSYVLIALLFGVEVLVRRARFGAATPIGWRALARERRSRA